MTVTPKGVQDLGTIVAQALAHCERVGAATTLEGDALVLWCEDQLRVIFGSAWPYVCEWLVEKGQPPESPRALDHEEKRKIVLQFARQAADGALARRRSS